MSNDSQCDYCHGVGACPKCWGRAGITKIESEVASLRAELDRAKGENERMRSAVAATCVLCDRDRLRAERGREQEASVLTLYQTAFESLRHMAKRDPTGEMSREANRLAREINEELDKRAALSHKEQP